MIPDIKRILYATDLSENARYAFGYAVSLANRHNAKITVLHVVEELSSFAQSMVADMMGEKRLADIKTGKEKEVISELKIRLEEFCDNVRHEQPSCPFVVDNTIVVTGHPRASGGSNCPSGRGNGCRFNRRRLTRQRRTC